MLSLISPVPERLFVSNLDVLDRPQPAACQEEDFLKFTAAISQQEGEKTPEQLIAQLFLKRIQGG